MSSILSWTHVDGSIVVFDTEKKKVVDYQISHSKRV